MQAIILAAGSSTRTYPLTLTKPKPLLKVAGKTLLEHNLEQLNNLVNELILVIGYKKNMIVEFIKKIKNNYKFKIKTIDQKEQLGTGHALSLCKDSVEDRFILLMGDDLYSKEDIKKCLKHKYSILAKKVANPEIFGVIVAHKNKAWEIIEKPQIFVSDLANCALYVLDKEVFDRLAKLKKSKRGEYEVTDLIKEIRTEGVYIEKADFWIPIGYPWDLLAADSTLRNGENIIGKNAKIEGKIENSFIDDNCIIEEEATIRDSIIYKNSIIKAGSLIEDSVIGENCEFSGEINSGDDVISVVKEKPVKVAHLGAVLADNVKADNAKIKPGCKIWPDKIIKGVIEHDVL